MTSTILIYERRPRWLPELERQFFLEDVRIRACSRLSDLEERIQEIPHAVAIVDFAASPNELLRMWGRLKTRGAFPTMIVVADPLYRSLEWTIRELGPLAFLEEPIPGDVMAAWCRRQFALNDSPNRNSPNPETTS